MFEPLSTPNEERERERERQKAKPADHEPLLARIADANFSCASMVIVCAGLTRSALSASRCPYIMHAQSQSSPPWLFSLSLSLSHGLSLYIYTHMYIFALFLARLSDVTVVLRSSVSARGPAPRPLNVSVVLRRSVSATARPPPSTRSFSPRSSDERGDEAQCLCQCPPSALSQVIDGKVERRESGDEAQCLCQRPPSSLSQAAALSPCTTRSNRSTCLEALG